MRLVPERRVGAKGQCTPKEAATLSLIVVLGGPLLALAAHVFYLVPLKTVFLHYALWSWLAVATAWCYVLWRTRSIVIKLWNTGIFIFLAILIACILTQEEGEEFPQWGINLMIKQGILWALAMSYFAAANFLKWMKGEI